MVYSRKGITPHRDSAGTPYLDDFTDIYCLAPLLARSISAAASTNLVDDHHRDGDYEEDDRHIGGSVIHYRR